MLEINLVVWLLVPKPTLNVTSRVNYTPRVNCIHVLLACVCVSSALVVKPVVIELLGFGTTQNHNEQDVSCAAVDLGAALGF